MTIFGKPLLLLTCLGMVAGQAVAADAPISAARIADVTLARTGGLTGRFVSSEGTGVDGAIVVLSQRDAVLAKSTTDAGGAWRFTGLRQGMYQVTVGHQTQTIRVWDETIAPPSARSLVTMVRQDQVVRGQGGGSLGTTVGVVGGIAGTALGIVAIVEAQDAKDEAKKASDMVNQMNPPPIHTVTSP